MLFPQLILSKKWVPNAYDNYFSYPTYQLRDAQAIKDTLINTIGFSSVDYTLIKMKNNLNIEQHLQFSWDGVKKSMEELYLKKQKSESEEAQDLEQAKQEYLQMARQALNEKSTDGGVTAELEAACWVIVATK